MKITAVTTYNLKVPLGEKRFFSSQCAFPERNSMLVKIDTDEGISGWGEGGQYGPAEPVKSCIENVLTPKLIGKNPLDKGCLWQQMYDETRDFGQKGTYIEAISAIDIALWDICGKYLKVPISMLLGGRYRETVSAYATGCYYRGEDYLDIDKSLADLVSEAQSYIEAGFKMLKFKIGLLSVEEDAKRILAIRRQVGNDVQLLVDCNHAYNAHTALSIGRLLEKSNILFMEEPVPPEDHEGYRRLREKLDIAIAGGECEYTAYGFKNLIAGGCVDIAQPDICVCGGLTEFQKILAIAGVYGTTVLPHVWGSGVALAAALSAISAMPLQPHTANPISFQNEPVIEYDRNINPLRDELLAEPITFKNGKVHVPSGNGLGIEIRNEILEKYSVN